MRWTRAVAVTLFVGVVFLSAAGFGEAASSAPAGTQAVTLAEGQRLTLRAGGYLTLKSGQLTLVNRAGAAKIFPGGSQVAQDSRGQVSILGSGGTTIVGLRNFDDPLLKPTSGAVNRSGALIDPALPGNVNRAGALVDPALPGNVNRAGAQIDPALPGNVNRAGVYVDPALPGNVNRAGAYIDPALPRVTQPIPIVTPNPAVR